MLSVEGESAEDQLRYPPGGLLVAAAISVLVGGALLFATGKAVNLVGYVASSVVVVALVSAYRLVDNRRRGPYYSPKPMWARASVAILIAGSVPAVLHIWRFATEVAR